MRIAGSVLALLTFVFMLNSLAIAQRPEGHFQQTLSVSGPVRLYISNGAGSIRVHKGDSNSVRVQAHIQADWQGDAALVREIEQNPPIRQSGNVITIGTEVHRWDHVSISYELAVPAQTQAGARTGAGSVVNHDVPPDALAVGVPARIRRKKESGGD